MPILARPVGTLTRSLMWCRRNQALAALAALLVLALVGGLAGVTWKWREADRERTKAEAVNELLTERLLAQASAELDPLARNLTVRELLDRTAAAARRLARRPARDRGQGPRDDRRRVSFARPVRPGGDAPPDRDPARHSTSRSQAPRTPRASNLLASLLDQTDRGAEAEPLLRRNLQDCRDQLGRDDPGHPRRGRTPGDDPLALGKTGRGRDGARQKRGRPLPRAQARAPRHAPVDLPA